jgi:hypothetical protein
MLSLLTINQVSHDGYGNVLHDIPSTIDQETTISSITRFGKSLPGLFSETTKTDPLQLVLIFEGITVENSKLLKDELAKAKRQPSFLISDPPSTTANRNLVNTDLRHAGARQPSDIECDVASVINPFDSRCWDGPASIALYDVQKASNYLQALRLPSPRY